jgi:hypothetical protein
MGEPLREPLTYLVGALMLVRAWQVMTHFWKG